LRGSFQEKGINNYPYKKMKNTKLPLGYMDEDAKNPFLILGFWEFAIISALVVSLFPLSLLFSLFFFGMERTVLLVSALFHDLVKTLMAALAVIVPLAILIIYLILSNS